MSTPHDKKPNDEKQTHRLFEKSQTNAFTSKPYVTAPSSASSSSSQPHTQQNPPASTQNNQLLNQGSNSTNSAGSAVVKSDSSSQTTNAYTFDQISINDFVIAIPQHPQRQPVAPAVSSSASSNSNSQKPMTLGAETENSKVLPIINQVSVSSASDQSKDNKNKGLFEKFLSGFGKHINSISREIKTTERGQRRMDSLARLVRSLALASGVNHKCIAIAYSSEKKLYITANNTVGLEKALAKLGGILNDLSTASKQIENTLINGNLTNNRFIASQKAAKKVLLQVQLGDSLEAAVNRLQAQDERHEVPGLLKQLGDAGKVFLDREIIGALRNYPRSNNLVILKNVDDMHAELVLLKEIAPDKIIKIGIDKLCCKLCGAFMYAYLKTYNNCQFEFRGTHAGAFKDNWEMPPKLTDNNTIFNHFIGVAANVFFTQLDEEYQKVIKSIFTKTQCMLPIWMKEKLKDTGYTLEHKDGLFIALFLAAEIEVKSVWNYEASSDDSDTETNAINMLNPQKSNLNPSNPQQPRNFVGNRQQPKVIPGPANRNLLNTSNQVIARQPPPQPQQQQPQQQNFIGNRQQPKVIPGPANRNLLNTSNQVIARQPPPQPQQQQPQQQNFVDNRQQRGGIPGPANRNLLTKSNQVIARQPPPQPQQQQQPPQVTSGPNDYDDEFADLVPESGMGSGSVITPLNQQQLRQNNFENLKRHRSKSDPSPDSRKINKLNHK